MELNRNRATGFFERRVGRGLINFVSDSSPLIVACSGGPDSSAALIAVVRVREHAGGGEVVAATFDHGLRPQVETDADIEVVQASHRLGEQLRGDDLLFTPDHAVLQGGVALVLTVQAMMNDLNVIDKTDEHVGPQLLHLIEIKGAEQPVSPPEGGVAETFSSGKPGPSGSSGSSSWKRTPTSPSARMDTGW